MAVGGDSAGGNLAAVVTQAARDTGSAMPVLQLLIYPMVDLGGETVSRTLFADGYFLTKADIDWFNTHYIGGADLSPTDIRVAPLRATDLSGLSPAVGADRADSIRCAMRVRRYAKALADAGVPVDLREYGSLTHGFVNFFPLGGGSEVALTDLTSALRAHLSR